MESDNTTNSFTFASHTISNTPLYSFENKKLWARVLSVHDGDTITCAIESFPGCFFRYNIRLAGIDTREMTSKGQSKDLAITSRNKLIAFITDNQIVLCETKIYTRTMIIAEFGRDVFLVYLDCDKMDKYGRVLARVYSPTNQKQSANAMLLETGLAQIYNGGTKQEFE